MNAIAACDVNWAIGIQGRLLVQIPADMRYFQEKTMGKVVVMGRKTWESLPGRKPLSGRINVVLSRQKGYKADGAYVVCGKEEALDFLRGYPSEDIYIIGGSQIYRLFLEQCNTAYITKLNYAYEADAFFPDLGKEKGWRLVWESEEETCFDLEYTYQKYER